MLGFEYFLHMFDKPAYEDVDMARGERRASKMGLRYYIISDNFPTAGRYRARRRGCNRIFFPRTPWFNGWGVNI
jgi:hypothetical protein